MSFLKNGNVEAGEAHVSIIFIFTAEGHEATWGTLSTVVFLDVWF
jgi:hypothetical protein